MDSGHKLCSADELCGIFDKLMNTRKPTGEGLYPPPDKTAKRVSRDILAPINSVSIWICSADGNDTVNKEKLCETSNCFEFNKYEKAIVGVRDHKRHSDRKDVSKEWEEDGITANVGNMSTKAVNYTK